MKLVIVFFALVAAAFAAEFYTTKYDNIDIDAILANPRLTTTYINCLLEKGKCNEEGKTLREVIPDALITGCKKCNEKQRASVRKVVQYLVKNRRADWDALIAKYDPQGEYRKNYQHLLDELDH